MTSLPRREPLLVLLQHSGHCRMRWHLMPPPDRPRPPRTMIMTSCRHFPHPASIFAMLWAPSTKTSPISLCNPFLVGATPPLAIPYSPYLFRLFRQRSGPFLFPHRRHCRRPVQLGHFHPRVRPRPLGSQSHSQPASIIFKPYTRLRLAARLACRLSLLRS